MVYHIIQYMDFYNIIRSIGWVPWTGKRVLARYFHRNVTIEFSQRLIV